MSFKTDLNEIIGHDAVVQRLRMALDADRVHQAYLFEGPKGLGKASLALWFAMAANCVDETAPCGVCDSCRQIAEGNHPDVWVVKPGAERSGTITVAQIREVVRKVGYHRYSAKRRVVIVDPAEAMNPTAANALLKTLEEPPDATGFILVSHQSDALLATILSRCQRIRFAPIGRKALSTWLNNRGVEDSERIAAFAQGCPGKALELNAGEWKQRMKLRDEFLVLSENGPERLFEWSKKLCAGNRGQWEPKVHQLLEVLEELLADVTRLATNRTDGLLHLDEMERIRQWTGRLWPMGVNRCVTAIEDARIDMERNVSGRLAVEALVSRFQAELRSA